MPTVNDDAFIRADAEFAALACEGGGGGGAPAGRAARELVDRVAATLRQRAGGWAPASAEGVARFTDAVLDLQPDLAEAQLSALRARGVSMDALCTGWLAGAAAELGRRWDEDEIGFAEVTLGMTRLHRLLRDLAPGVTPRRPAARAFVAAAPGETHVFGPMMIADQLRRQGWEVQIDVSGAPEAAALQAVGTGALDVVGLSAATAVVAPGVAAMIAALRARIATLPEGSASPLIVVGGALARHDPAALRESGADVIARGAADLARALEKAQARRLIGA